MIIPWSFTEDKLVLESTLTANDLSHKINRSAQAIRIRRAQLKNTTVDNLITQELYIIAQHKSMAAVSIARNLKVTKSTIYSRVKALISEGKIEPPDEELVRLKNETKVREEYKIERYKANPMQKVMKLQYQAVPKEALSKAKIQADLLEVHKEYKITTKRKSDRNSTKLKSEKLMLIGCYPNHYLFTGINGMKHTLNKVDYYLGEWKYELC